MERSNARMDAETLIKEYEMFKVLTQQMLEGVKNDEWDCIAQIGERREKLLKELMALDDTLMTDSVERMHWSELIRQCLEMNGEMQTLIEEKRGALLKNYNNQKKMFQAYHSHSGG